MISQVIIINGAPRAGKDTFSHALIQSGYNVVNYSTINAMKGVATLMGWAGEKDDTTRYMLSELKQFYIKHFDGVMRDLRDAVEAHQISEVKADAFIIHCREPEEINDIVCYFNTRGINVATLFVDRPDTEKEGYSNESDANVANYQYDFRLMNNGSENDWYALCQDFFVEEFLKAPRNVV